MVGGALGGDAQTIIWAVAAVLLWLTPRFTSVEGLVIGVAHFVERHGLVVIIALGESIVVLGVGTEGLELDAGIVSSRCSRSRSTPRCGGSTSATRTRSRTRSTTRRPSAARSSR